MSRQPPMRGTEKFGLAISGWFVGLCIGIGTSMVLAWAWNAWEAYRRGLGIGLLAIVVVFWGAVMGGFVLGPAAAVVAVKRGSGPTEIGPRARRVAIVGAALFGAVVVAVVVGARGCRANMWPACRGLPSHTSIGRVSLARVIPDADGSRLALVGYVGRTKISVVNAASFTPIATLAVPRGGGPTDPGWMPDGRAIVAVYHGAVGADDIGIFSSDTGRMTWSAPLPFRVADRGGPVVSPDGTHALIVGAHGRDPYGTRLYTVDLRSGAVTETRASFQNTVTSPVYLDEGRVAIIEHHLGYSGLSEIDLGSGSVRSLTSSDLDVFDLAGVDASGDVVFTGYHVTPDPYVSTTEDREHPIVGEVSVETGAVRDLFEPGVIGALRTFDAGDRAVALADTCTGDCGGGEEVWVLDLSRY